jgi:hypothetical protein
MKKLSLSACCISTLLFAGTGLACDYPDRPEVPNGSTASKEEMIAGQKEVNGYIKELEAYQECIVEEEEAARAELGELEDDDLKQREELLTKKFNAAHDEMMKAAAAFNNELKEFQSRDE